MSVWGLATCFQGSVATFGGWLPSCPGSVGRVLCGKEQWGLTNCCHQPCLITTVKTQSQGTGQQKKSRGCPWDYWGFLHVWPAECLNKHRSHELIPARRDMCRHVGARIHKFYSNAHSVTCQDFRYQQGWLPSKRTRLWWHCPSSSKNESSVPFVFVSLRGSGEKRKQLPARSLHHTKRWKNLKILRLFRLYILKGNSPK